MLKNNSCVFMNMITTWVSVIFLVTIPNIIHGQNNDKDYLILDMARIWNGPKGIIGSKFEDPNLLAEYGFNGKVYNELIPLHALINYKSFDSTLIPTNSLVDKWINEKTNRINEIINEAHDAGIKIYIFTDVLLFPRVLINKYSNQIKNEDNKIDISKPLTKQLLRYAIDESLKKFPKVDGLIIRSGETYTANIPYHNGNNPILHDSQMVDTHVWMINMLVDEVIEKHNKTLIYRTWDLGYGFHIVPTIYTNITSQIEVNEKLIFSIKHTSGDFNRLLKPNQTLGLGDHQQIVEVQAQREYEGKGAHPNYITRGVLKGFSDTPKQGYYSLETFRKHKNFKGLWIWSRGGGSLGPYITHELWVDLNVYTLVRWINNPNKTEEDVFNEFMDKIGVHQNSKSHFRKLALLSQSAVLYGRYSLVATANILWSRDDFIHGLELLEPYFAELSKKHLMNDAFEEKKYSVTLWKHMVDLSDSISIADSQTEEFMKLSTKYGYLLYSIFNSGWRIMGIGFDGVTNEEFFSLQEEILNYYNLWDEYRSYEANNELFSTVYKPWGYYMKSESDVGMHKSVFDIKQKVTEVYDSFINGNKKVDFILYPNPFNSSATIKILNASQQPMSYFIHDTLGREVDKGTINISNSVITTLLWPPNNQSNLSSGNYFLTIKDSQNNFKTKGFVIVK